MRRYRLKALGTYNRVVTSKRSYLAQCMGRLAAISVPTAEMRRLWQECNGNMETVLAPMRTALQEQGFTDLFILPAQTTLVELEALDDVPVAMAQDPGIYIHRTEQLKELMRHSKAVVEAQGAPNLLKQKIEALHSHLAQCDVELWER